MIYNQELNNNMTKPRRIIKCAVVLLEGTTATPISNDLIEVKIDRSGEEGKFFGFGIIQKVTITFRDKDRTRDINNITGIDKIEFTNTDTGINSEVVLTKLKITDSTRDENNNNITLTCNDRLIDTNTLTVNDLGVNGDYHINTILEAVVNKLELSNYIAGIDVNGVSDKYPEVANLDGTEKVRDVLDDIAEITQTIYFINAYNELQFKILDINNDADLDITKSDYFTLKSGETHKLATITHITELGENYTNTKSGITGVEQILRENCFLNNNPEAATVIDEAVNNICGLSITEFTLSWRGNFLTEIGDKIKVTTKDNKTITTYILNDSITFNGGMKQETSWSYKPQEAPAANPTNIGEAIKQTFARVDKINKQITLLASEEEANKKAIAQLQVNTDNITSSVKAVEDATKQNAENVNKDIAELESKITQTAENLNLEFTSKLEDIDSVTTSTGFTFNKDGLKVSKSGSEMTTQITEDGMKVFRNDVEMLTANNNGVNAVNLHATTYLIIGNNSRFEDMGSSRTGCFWIGG